MWLTIGLGRLHHTGLQEKTVLRKADSAAGCVTVLLLAGVKTTFAKPSNLAFFDLNTFDRVI